MPTRQDPRGTTPGQGGRDPSYERGVCPVLRRSMNIRDLDIHGISFPFSRKSEQPDAVVVVSGDARGRRQ